MKNKKNKIPFLKKHAGIFIPAAIAAITWLFLKVCLNNYFTNWDDFDYILTNPMIKDVSWEGLMAIFSTPVMGNYQPLTILSYAIEYSYVSFAPWLYHLNSLLLHIAVTLLVYRLVNILTKRRVAATITALLFGLHPMHVESVAWVAGRKDELCALCYFTSCIAYVYYIRSSSGGWRWYSIAIFTFFCAILSKPIAVLLPPVLLLIDYFEGRAWSKNILVEKIPFFILSVIFGIISIRSQYAAGTVNIQAVHYSVIERVALGAYAFVSYLWKAIVPAHLCCFYPYPSKINGSLPFTFYIYPFAVAALIFIVWKYARSRVIVFGLLFFIVNISLLLQFIPVGSALLADRYTYIPYAGLFFIAGWYASEYFEHFKKPFNTPVTIAIISCLLTLGYLSYQRCMVWYNPVSLWTDELKKEPQAPVAYVSLGTVYYDLWQNATDPVEKQVMYDSAFYLMKTSIVLCPDSAGEYQALGMLYYDKHNYDSADLCFKTYLRLKPSPEEHGRYGNFLVMMGKDDAAIKQYEIAISQNPDLFAPYLNLGELYRKRNQWEEAMKNFNAAIAINPRSGEAYYARSFCDTQIVGKPPALRDVETAIALGYNKVDTGYYQWLKK